MTSVESRLMVVSWSRLKRSYRNPEQVFRACCLPYVFLCTAGINSLNLDLVFTDQLAEEHEVVHRDLLQLEEQGPWRSEDDVHPEVSPHVYHSGHLLEEVVHQEQIVHYVVPELAFLRIRLLSARMRTLFEPIPPTSCRVKSPSSEFM